MGRLAVDDEQLRLRYLDSSPWVAAAGEGRAGRCRRSNGHIDDGRIENAIENGTAGFVGLEEVRVTCAATRDLIRRRVRDRGENKRKHQL